MRIHTVSNVQIEHAARAEEYRCHEILFLWHFAVEAQIVWFAAVFCAHLVLSSFSLDRCPEGEPKKANFRKAAERYFASCVQRIVGTAARWLHTKPYLQRFGITCRAPPRRVACSRASGRPPQRNRNRIQCQNGGPALHLAIRR